MNKTLIIVGLVVVASACSNSSNEIKAQKGEIVSNAAAGDLSDKELKESLKEIRAEEEKQLAIERASNTTLSFDKLKHDFGNVKPEVENVTEFVVTNTGKNPLIISDVSASCGCTMPQKPEAPILPGKSDVIKVAFKSKPGQENEIKKTVTVTANTDDKIHLLEIRAFVK